MGSKTRGAVLGFVVAFASGFAGLTGCTAVRSAQRGNAMDARGTAAVGDAMPRLVVAGPTRLLHVDIHGGAALVYRAARRTGTLLDCQGPGLEPGSLARGNRRTILDLGVSSDQVACLVAVDPIDGHRHPAIEVSWHARGDGSPAIPDREAMSEVIASNR